MLQLAWLGTVDSACGSLARRFLNVYSFMHFPVVLIDLLGNVFTQRHTVSHTAVGNDRLIWPGLTGPVTVGRLSLRAGPGAPRESVTAGRPWGPAGVSSHCAGRRLGG
jgi:hypothetical protein